MRSKGPRLVALSVASWFDDFVFDLVVSLPSAFSLGFSRFSLASCEALQQSSVRLRMLLDALQGAKF